MEEVLTVIRAVGLVVTQSPSTGLSAEGLREDRGEKLELSVQATLGGVLL